MLINEHYGAIEADWIRYYNRDLKSDLWGSNHIGVRQLLSMIQWLPPESALWRSTGKSWSTDNELQALSIEMLDSFIKLYIQANSKPNASKKYKPLHIPRPYDNDEKIEKRSTTLNELINKGVFVKKAKGGDQWQE